MKDYAVTRYRTHINRPEIGSGSFRIVFLSDKHNAPWGERDELLLSLVDKEKPDIVLCGGDMLIAYPGKDVSQAADFMNRLSKRHLTFYGLGNHEYRLRLYPETYGDMYQRYMSLLDKTYVHLLDDAKAGITVNSIPVSIYGFTVKRKYYHRFKRIPMTVNEITRVFERPGQNSISLLMAHTPKYLKAYFKWGADITLSGHYHGGIMQLKGTKGLLSPDLTIFPHNAHGIIREGSSMMLVSAGLGEHTLPLRIRNRRELVVLDVSVNQTD